MMVYEASAFEYYGLSALVLLIALAYMASKK